MRQHHNGKARRSPRPCGWQPKMHGRCWAQLRSLRQSGSHRLEASPQSRLTMPRMRQMHNKRRLRQSLSQPLRLLLLLLIPIMWTWRRMLRSKMPFWKPSSARQAGADGAFFHTPARVPVLAQPCSWPALASGGSRRMGREWWRITPCNVTACNSFSSFLNEPASANSDPVLGQEVHVVDMQRARGVESGLAKRGWGAIITAATPSEGGHGHGGCARRQHHGMA